MKEFFRICAITGLCLGFTLAGGGKVLFGAESPAAGNKSAVFHIGSLAGNASIHRAEKVIKVDNPDPLKGTTVQSADRIILSKGESCFLTFSDGRKVKFSGEGEYHLQGKEIKIVRGGLVVSFSSSPRGYKVRMPTVTLGIRGTILHLMIDGKLEWVFVDEGCVEWENTKSGAKGVLKTGEGVKAEGKTVSTIKKSPLSDQPSLNPTKSPEKPGKENPFNSDSTPPVASWPVPAIFPYTE